MTDTAFYNEMSELAEELIGDFGRPVTLVKAGQQAGFDQYGNVIGATPDITANGLGCSLDYKIGEIDGSIIQNGDAKLLYKGETPEIDMTVTLDGVKWRIVEPNPLKPAGILVMYSLQLRK